MTRIAYTTLLLTALLGTAACSKNKCEFENDQEKTTFGPLADMTQGAFSCYVSSAEGKPELVASHGDEKVDAVAGKYKAWLEAQQWKVEMSPHAGQRANGKSYEGQILKAEKDGKTAMTLVYPLADTITETVTTVE